ANGTCLCGASRGGGGGPSRPVSAENRGTTAEEVTERPRRPHGICAVDEWVVKAAIRRKVKFFRAPSRAGRVSIRSVVPVPLGHAACCGWLTFVSFNPNGQCGEHGGRGRMTGEMRGEKAHIQAGSRSVS